VPAESVRPSSIVSLARFHDAQGQSSTGYDTALAEIRSGQKRNHWIWYVFPQLEGLGRSSTARAYGLRDLDEACDYLRDPLLRGRYQEIAEAVRQQLAHGVDLEQLMGSSIDALKLVSSVTLFQAAAEALSKQDPVFNSIVQCCSSILEQTAAQGYPVCSQTLGKIER
jgi:uncharacterized protein (DUF1810 family)